MDLVQLSITDDQLRQSNELTRASIKPGYLDYAAYRQYLIVNGHVDPARVTAAGSAPTLPHNSSLQSNNGDRTDSMTDYRADQAFWSQDNLPEVIYIFLKPTNRFTKQELREPPMKTYNIYGAKLRDIPILPDHISSDVEGWRLEAWFRFDARVSLTDIMDRIEVDRRPANKSVLNMRSLRFRDDCMVLGWCAAGKKYADRKAEIENEMAAKGISTTRNSTRGVSWGLTNMAYGTDEARIIVPENRRVRNTVDLTGVSSGPVAALPAPDTALQALITIFPAPVAALPAPAIALVGPLQPQLTASTPTKQDVSLSATLKRAEVAHSLVKADNANPVPAITNDLFLLPHNDMDMDMDMDNWVNFENATVPEPDTAPVNEPAVTVMYDSEPLVLKNNQDRLKGPMEDNELLEKWYPFGHKSRREQLAFLLDPERLEGGFVDNVGYWPPTEAGRGCMAADIVYGAKTL